MNKKIVLAAALFFAFSPAMADEPIKSLDGFEADMKKCLMKDMKPAACLGQVMGGHFSPGNEKLNEVVTQLVSVLDQWLGQNRVFAMHPVLNKALGDFFVEKAYLIEDDGGNVILLETSFVHSLGKWYLHRFNLSSRKDRMQTVLGVDL